MVEGKTLKNWSIKRSGGRMTINGDNADTGKIDKITGVDTVTQPEHITDQFVLATDRHKVVHKLLLG